MKIYLAAISIFSLCVLQCGAQTIEKQKHNAVSLELGKTGLIYNLNFDHRFDSKNIGLRVGAGSNLGRYLKVTSVGGGAYYLAGKKKRYLELGLDIQYLIVDEVSDDQKGLSSMLVYPDYSTKTFYPSLNLGLRRYGKNTLFRIGVSPGRIADEFIPGAYVSYGITF